MKTPRQQYLEECRKLTPLIAFCQALMRRIPQKYEPQIIALLRAHPQLAQTQRLETTTAWLGLVWQCPATQVAALLRRMTARSKGDVTYQLGDQVPSMGHQVTLTCTIPEATEESV